jgi:hypothetical protein
MRVWVRESKSENSGSLLLRKNAILLPKQGKSSRFSSFLLIAFDGEKETALFHN